MDALSYNMDKKKHMKKPVSDHRWTSIKQCPNLSVIPPSTIKRGGAYWIGSQFQVFTTQSNACTDNHLWFIFKFLVDILFVSLSLSPHDIVTVSPLTPHISVINTRFFWVSWCFFQKICPPFFVAVLSVLQGATWAQSHRSKWCGPPCGGLVSDWIHLRLENLHNFKKKHPASYWDIQIIHDSGFPPEILCIPWPIRGLRSHVFCEKMDRSDKKRTRWGEWG